LLLVKEKDLCGSREYAIERDEGLVVRSQTLCSGALKAQERL
jgi:hypothetical protein